MSIPKYDQVVIDITDYVFNFEIQDAHVLQRARFALLDAMGCAIETVSKSADCRRILGPIVPGSETANGFRLPGTAYQLDPLKGAFDLGTAIRFLDHNDALAGADWGHPSDNLGAIIAVADWLNRASQSGTVKHAGPPLTVHTLLVALVKAYEIQGCMLIRNAFNAHGLDHVILVKLASTATSSWLMGLSKEQTMAAISHVWMDGHPLRVYRSGQNTIPRKGWAAGEACMKAVNLAVLTRAGQPGAPTALTMPRWGFYAVSFGDKEFDLPKRYGTWAIEHTFTKVMPVEGHGVSAVEAALEQKKIMQARGIAADQIARVNIRTNAAANMIINKKGPLYNSADRDHCMQYCVALALLKGTAPEAEDFQDGSIWASSRALETLRDRIDICEDPQLTRDYLDIEKRSMGSGLTVHLDDNTVLAESLVDFPVGHVKNAKTAETVREKFLRNMRLSFSEAEIEKILYNLLDRDDRSVSVSEFVDLFVRETPVRAERL